MKKVSDSTVARLSKYYRSLEIFLLQGKSSVSSDDLADQDGITSAQVRKDLSFFGTFGKRGIGYNTEELYAQIKDILGLKQKWNVAIVGAGNIGNALINFQEFRDRGFLIKAIFDSNPNKIGLDIGGLTIHNMENFQQRVRHLSIQIGIIAVPAEYAQQVAELMIGAGIKAIMNFAPKNIKVPKEIVVRNTNIAINLETIAYHLYNPDQK